MLTDADVGNLFSQMQAAYGHQWPHKAGAMPMWKRALGGFSRDDIFRAVGKAVKAYPDFPPSLGQFTSMVDYGLPALPGPDNAHDNAALAGRIYEYAFPFDKVKNPKGNPHHVKLPESIAARKPGEPIPDYEKRIADAVTIAMYPQLQARR